MNETRAKHWQPLRPGSSGRDSWEAGSTWGNTTTQLTTLILAAFAVT
jgi:hypothetical protein